MHSSVSEAEGHTYSENKPAMSGQWADVVVTKKVRGFRHSGIFILGLWSVTACGSLQTYVALSGLCLSVCVCGHPDWNQEFLVLQFDFSRGLRLMSCGLGRYLSVALT